MNVIEDKPHTLLQIRYRVRPLEGKQSFADVSVTSISFNDLMEKFECFPFSENSERFSISFIDCFLFFGLKFGEMKPYRKKNKLTLGSKDDTQNNNNIFGVRIF